MYRPAWSENGTATRASYDPEEVGLIEVESSRELLLLVWAAGARIALPVSQVREIHKDVKISTVPGSPPVLHGVANIRGAIVTVLDLGIALMAQNDTPDSEYEIFPKATNTGRGSQGSSVVLLEYGSHVYGIRVDEVSTVLTRDEAPIVPSTLGSVMGIPCFGSDLTGGIVAASGLDIPMLDVGALCTQYLILTE